jgi:methylated-DNA-protein-cysteine methyltransferase-like protein
MYGKICYTLPSIALPLLNLLILDYFLYQDMERIVMTESSRRIAAAIRAIPPGKVSSYRDVALAAGMPNGARQTAWILHSLTESQKLPWHRVIKTCGRLALAPGNGRELQISLLRAEGVEVSDDGEVDMARYRFISI